MTVSNIAPISPKGYKILLPDEMPLYWGDLEGDCFVPIDAKVVKIKNESAAPSTEAVAVSTAPMSCPKKEDEHIPVASAAETHPIIIQALDNGLDPKYSGLLMAAIKVMTHKSAPVPCPKKEDAQPEALPELKFKVMRRQYDERGLHGSSYISDAGADGKPSELPPCNAAEAVRKYLMDKKPMWITKHLTSPMNMTALKETSVKVNGKPTSLWDTLSNDTNQKVAGVFVESYWDSNTGEWRGYFTESA